MGLAATTNPNDAERLVQNALDLATFGPQAYFHLPDHNSFTPVQVHDPQTEAISMDDMAQLGQTLIEDILRYDKNLLCEARVSRSLSTVTLVNSRGGSFSYKRSSFYASIEANMIRDGDMLFVWDDYGSCSPVKDISPLVQSVVKRVELSRNIVPAPSGDIPVIFSPRAVASVLLGPLLAGFSGKLVFEGVSPLVGKAGQQVVDKRFSLWDDPTIPLILSSRMCDDEGMPAKRMTLIESGVVKNFFYDLQSAGQAKTASTGSAHRTIYTLPEAGPSVLVLGQGDTSYAHMVSDISDGLIVDQVLGAGQSNVLGGDFKANVLLGYRVQDGKITGRVKDTLISGNSYKALSELAAIGNEMYWVHGTLLLAPLYCKAVRVASKD
jgi:PmbA protein